jgi:signal transduction histidine kinase
VCGLDPEPRSLKDGKTLSTLKLFSQLISLQLAADERHETARKQLEAEREAATLREQFIAVLGHDVRNPLSSIVTGARILLAKSSADGERRTLNRIHGSAQRIAALVDDLLDLARGRLAGGITLQAVDAPALGDRLEHVVAEMRAAHPERDIELASRIDRPVRCDQARVEQLLSNLLANAVAHGDSASPIAVMLSTRGDRFEISVENRGPTIPEGLRTRLFQPYFRGDGSSPRGLGLGLYIVSEIVKSHGGTIEVSSHEGRTSFHVVIPLAGAPRR